MKNDYNWEKAFPQSTEKFHKRVCETLNNLEKERFRMKKTKIIAIAAAAVMAIGIGGAIASNGTVRSIVGSSTSFPNYKELPTAAQTEEKLGVVPKLIEEFSNGYAFENAVDVSNRIEDVSEDGKRIIIETDNGKQGRYMSIAMHYKNGEDEISLNVQPTGYMEDSDDADKTENYKGVSIRYNSFANKFVPADYVQTAQDIKDEDEGKYIFSYGTDDIEIHYVQGVSWTQDGVDYHINAMDSLLGEQELIDMAKEAIDF